VRRGGARCVETAARLECRQVNIVCNLFFTNQLSHAKRKIVDRCLHCVLEDLGVDDGAGGEQHLCFGAQEDVRCIHT